MNFKLVPLGQRIMCTQVPLEIFSIINGIYENNFKSLKPANKQLLGKIEKEHSLFYSGTSNNKQVTHSLLSAYVLDWFLSVYKTYMKAIGIPPIHMKLSSIWINEMKDNEYNPVHIHQGEIYTGLSSVMCLKLPSHYGKEYSAEDSPTNGKLNILGNSTGQFALTDFQPQLKEGSFYIFPYDMRHTVYPFNGTNEFRRTLAANCDVTYNEIKYRGASL